MFVTLRLNANKMISQDNLHFLENLKDNNNKEWFDANRKNFEKYQNEFKSFHRHVEKLIASHDHLEGGKTFRIYKDVRFSKDKTPYKTHWSGTYKRATSLLRGGYYYQIEPGRSFVAGGFFGPNPQDLLHIRKQISQYPDPLLEVLNTSNFKNIFGLLVGEQVKTSPKGFSVDDPAIDLIRYKQFIIEHHFTDKEVTSANFAENLNNHFRAMRPYFDIMSEYLTTDLNGESLFN